MLKTANRGRARWQIVPAHELEDSNFRLRDPPMARRTANLSFLPWVRQGAAGAIAAVDTLGPKQPAVADVSVTLKVNADQLPAVPLRLRGPADVVGIDRHQVVRTDPRPDTSDFEPNCFPSIEFDRADFPWLFTPARANTNGQLRPWLCLVVVRQQDGVQLDERGGRAAADAQDRGAGEAVPRAARPEGLLGVGARPGRGRQRQRRRRGVERPAAARRCRGWCARGC